MNRPVQWIATLPLLLIPCCWLWWWAAGLNPGVEIGRSADLLLCVGCGAAMWAVRGATIPVATLPLLFALAWQALALLWAPVREPGVVWLIERAAACASSLALARWCATAETPRLIAAAAVCGSGLLVLTCLTQIPDLGAWLRVHREAPFGNVNFTVGAALPLAALGIARFLHTGSRRWWLYAIATAGCAGALAKGWLGGDPCQAVWLGGAAAITSALILRLPGRWHGPLLLAGAAALLVAWVIPVAGWTEPPGSGAGTAQRVHIWRASIESLAGPALLIGHGPAAIITVLPEQPSFAALWLTVPSYAAHAHAEPLQILCDGGLVLAGLLVWALVITLRPLWRRRDEPAIAALLVAWCTAGTLALIESHLSQPGGLLCLALLGGLSWAAAGENLAITVPVPLRVTLPLLGAAALAMLMGRELAADGGGPVGIEARSQRHQGGDPAADLADLDLLRRRLGPLDDLDLRRAYNLGRLGRLTEADAALIAHMDRNPAQAAGLALARRRIASGQAPAALVAAAAAARQRAAALRLSITRNPVNGAALDALAAELSRGTDDDPAPAR